MVAAGRFWGETPPATPVSPAEAVALAADLFGVVGTARPLGSNQETNLLLTADGGDRYVLKVANPAFGADVLDLQNRAMLHVAAAETGLAVPEPVAARDGSHLVVTQIRGVDHHVRLLTFVAGDLLSDAGYLSDDALAAFGRLAARLSSALAGFDHPAADRLLQYDGRQARGVVDALAGSVADPARRAAAVDLSTAAWQRLDPLADRLRTQAVHADLADHNVVAARDDDGRLMPTGVIDFGDVVRSWVVGDLATAITSLLVRTRRSPLLDALAVVRGFHAVDPLTEPEVAALWPLVAARAAVLAVSVDDILAADPGNAYAREEQPLDWLILDRAAAVPFDLAEAALRSATGLDPSPAAQAAAAWRPARAVLDLDPADVVGLDLSTTSPLLDDGRWTDSAATRAGVEAALARPRRAPAVGVGGHGEGRLVATAVDTATPGATVHLGLDATVPAGTSVRAPADATLRQAGPRHVVLGCGDVDVQPGEVEPAVRAGDRVAAGDVVATVRPAASGNALPAHLHVQLTVPELPHTPLVTPELAEAWLAVSPNPAALLGLASTGSLTLAPAGRPGLLDGAALVARRDAVLATVQEHFFAHPPRIERGWRQHLVDTSGRAYLDMVNNVAVLGHSHPAVTEAAARQYRLLNTNSRFSYEANVAYAEAIVATLPAELDTVLLVSSGSEAIDLALRIARNAIGRADTVCLAGAYHGWTAAADAISTTLNDNPRSRETRPPWVHLAAMPNLYRGEHRGPDAADRYADSVREVLAGLADGPACFVAEPLSGNQGGVDLPPGYLAQVYAAVRAAGGLCVSDEVQIGYGRTGDAFWGFQLHGVVPDLVTMAKAAGNGHPVGFVVTRRDIADAFAEQGSFFSSVGGSPVSSVVGRAVLDAVLAEDLPGNARRIGAHLRERLLALQERHPMIGHVHGRGLYQGVELVRDRQTREPATCEAALVCERLRELGVIEHATGDYANVLKVKPPLVITESSADFFVDQLDEVLASGW